MARPARGPSVYGLAISMVDMLSGGPPIDGSIAQMMFAALNESRRPTPRIVGVTVADAVERTFQRALAVDPKKRTPSVEAFWTELELALDMKPSMKRLDARAEKGDSMPPPPGAMDLPSLEVPALAPPPVPKPAAPLSHSVRVVDPVDLAAEERGMSFGLTTQPHYRGSLPPPSLHSRMCRFIRSEMPNRRRPRALAQNSLRRSGSSSLRWR